MYTLRVELQRVFTRLLTKRSPFRLNRAGYYYFSKRVPTDLVHHYSYPRIVEGLKTKFSHVAKTRALVAAGKLDGYWSYLRMTDPKINREEPFERGIPTKFSNK